MWRQPEPGERSLDGRRRLPECLLEDHVLAVLAGDARRVGLIHIDRQRYIAEPCSVRVVWRVIPNHLPT